MRTNFVETSLCPECGLPTYLTKRYNLQYVRCSSQRCDWGDFAYTTAGVGAHTRTSTATAVDIAHTGTSFKLGSVFPLNTR